MSEYQDRAQDKIASPQVRPKDAESGSAVEFIDNRSSTKLNQQLQLLADNRKTSISSIHPVEANLSSIANQKTKIIRASVQLARNKGRKAKRVERAVTAIKKKRGKANRLAGKTRLMETSKKRWVSESTIDGAPRIGINKDHQISKRKKKKGKSRMNTTTATKWANLLASREAVFKRVRDRSDTVKFQATRTRKNGKTQTLLAKQPQKGIYPVFIEGDKDVTDSDTEELTPTVQQKPK